MNTYHKSNVKQRMKPKVIFIRSLGHSGSTMLSQIIAKKNGFVQLGEIFNFFKHHYSDKLKPNRKCSCGSKYLECSFWKQIIEETKYIENDSERYLKTIQLSTDKFKKPIIDIGKHDDSYEIVKELAKQKKIDLHVLYLFRGSKGWVSSSLRRMNKKDIFTTLKLFLSWFKRNNMLYKESQESFVDNSLLSYEELTLFNNDKLKLCEIYTFENPTLSPTQHHIITGNIKSVKKELEIVYDFRWFQNKTVQFCYLLLPKIETFEKKIILNKLEEHYIKKTQKNIA